MIHPEGSLTSLEEAIPLRDRVVQGLPDNFDVLQEAVSLTYLPLAEEQIDEEQKPPNVKLVMEYLPSDGSVSIDVFETLYEEGEESSDWDTYQRFIYRRELELDIRTGRMLLYRERGEVRDQYDNIVGFSPAEPVLAPSARVSGEEMAGRRREQAKVMRLRDAIDKPVFETFNQEKMDYLLGLLDRL